MELIVGMNSVLRLLIRLIHRGVAGGKSPLLSLSGGSPNFTFGIWSFAL